MKRNNLLQALQRAGTASRLQLANSLAISNSRVCDLIDGMIEESLIAEDEVIGNRRGRRGVGVRLNPGRGHWIGIDMEAKRLRLVVTDFAGTPVWQRMTPLENIRNGDDFLARVLRFYDESSAEFSSQFPNILGIGLAASGVTDIARGVILHYDMLPDVKDLPLRDRVAAHTGLPCIMQNNIRAMTLAEWTSGAAKGLSTFVCVAVRSGVGAGVVVNDKLLTGAHGLCGEVGYMILPNAGPSTGWPTLQQMVSESALNVDVEHGTSAIDPSMAQRVGQLIGSQLASIAVVIDPEAIILAGGLLAPDGPVWQAAIDGFQSTAMPEVLHHTKLLPAQLGPFAAAIGAAQRCLYEIVV